MWNAGTVMNTLKEAKSYGINAEVHGFNWRQLVESRDAYVTRLNGIYGNMLSNSNVEHIEGWGMFTGDKEITVTDGNVYTADNILIAVGGVPTVPVHMKGIEHSITSDGFFELEEQPKKAAVVGAGYIAVELASALNKLGTDTSLFIRKDKVLRGKEVGKEN